MGRTHYRGLDEMTIRDDMKAVEREWGSAKAAYSHLGVPFADWVNCLTGKKPVTEQIMRALYGLTGTDLRAAAFPPVEDEVIRQEPASEIPGDWARGEAGREARYTEGDSVPEAETAAGAGTEEPQVVTAGETAPSEPVYVEADPVPPMAEPAFPLGLPDVPEWLAPALDALAVERRACDARLDDLREQIRALVEKAGKIEAAHEALLALAGGAA